MKAASLSPRFKYAHVLAVFRAIAPLEPVVKPFPQLLQVFNLIDCRELFLVRSHGEEAPLFFAHCFVEPVEQVRAPFERVLRATIRAPPHFAPYVNNRSITGLKVIAHHDAFNSLTKTHNLLP